MPFCVDTIKALINVCSSAHPTSAAVDVFHFSVFDCISSTFFIILKNCAHVMIVHEFLFVEVMLERERNGFVSVSAAWSPHLFSCYFHWDEDAWMGKQQFGYWIDFFPLSLSLVMMGLTNSTGRMVGYDGRVSWGKNENQAFRRRRQQFGNETQPPRCVSPKHSVGGYFHSPISDSIQYN